MTVVPPPNPPQDVPMAPHTFVTGGHLGLGSRPPHFRPVAPSIADEPDGRYGEMYLCVASLKRRDRITSGTSSIWTVSTVYALPRTFEKMTGGN